MMYRNWAGIALLAVLFLAGCSPKQHETIVLEVGKDKINLGEYERFFSRNSGGWDAAQKSTPEERERFLDLLTNYRLKLKDAYDQRLDSDPEIVQELAEYRASLAATFIIEKEVTEVGVRRLYERRKEELRADRFMVGFRIIATPEETLKAYEKAQELIRTLKAGASVDSLAAAFAADSTSGISYEDVYYFTGGQIEAQFERLAYSLKQGEVSPAPLRTRTGYVVARIAERQPVRGSMKVRHIMARFQSMDPDSADSAAAYTRIKDLQDSLKGGANFMELAKKSSDDATASDGGDLGWFERRRWVQPFDEAALKLNPGEVSDIVQTPWGYHLIYCDSVKPLAPFETIQEDLKKTFQQALFTDEYTQYIGTLKSRLKYAFNEQAFDAFAATLDSTKTIEDSTWKSKLTPEVRSLAIMTIGAKKIPLDTVVASLQKRPEFRNTPLRRNEIRSRFDRIAETFILSEHSQGLESRIPEFGALMQEYEDGVILFKAEQNQVWNKVAVSDSALREFFDANRQRFMTPDQVEYSEILVSSDTAAIMLYDSLTRGADFGDLAARHNEDPDLKDARGAHELEPADAGPLAARAATMEIGEISEPIEMEGEGYSIIKLTAKQPPRMKTYEEAGAEVSNAFQEHESKRLEKEWLDQLKVKYPVKQYKEQLRAAFSSSPQAMH